MRPPAPLNHSFSTTKLKKSGPWHQRRLHLLEHTKRDYFGVRFYFNTNECIYTHRVKNVQNYHHLNVKCNDEWFWHQRCLHVLLRRTPASLTTVRNLYPLFHDPSSSILLLPYPFKTITYPLNFLFLFPTKGGIVQTSEMFSDRCKSHDFHSLEMCT